MGNLVRRTLKERPHLHIGKHRNSLNFTFKFSGSLTRAIRKENPRLYRILFEPRKKNDWTDILLQAYHERASKNDKKSVKQWLRFWLNRVFLNAYDILLRNPNLQGLSMQDKDYINSEIEAHKQFLKRKSGPPNSQRRQEEDAIRFAKLHATLKPHARKLKTFVSQHKFEDDKVLAQALENEFRFEWLHHVTQGTALKHLPTIDNDLATTESQLNGRWKAWQLSVGVIYCKEEALQGRIKRQPNTIYSYIIKGNALLKKRTPAPTPASRA